MRHGLERIIAALVRKPGQHPSAFSSLRAVSEQGLEAFDGVRQMKVPWAGIQSIYAAMGRQQYDMTHILSVHHSAGRSVFVPEVKALWAPLIAAMAIYLRGALTPDDWLARLSANPEASIRVYRRPGVLW